MTAPLRVLIADDEALVRGGFRVLVETEPGMVVVGEAGDGATAVDLARTTRPDVVLMDIRMPGVDGLHVAFTHSGATLGLIAGELLAEEIVTGDPSPLLDAFRPDRFTA